MHACTIVARNYLAFARVLAESFLSIHPDSSFTTLVVDAEFGLEDRDEPFQVLTPAELDLSQDEFHRMAVMYDVTELSTALKPWALRYLIEHGAEAALYIDPDIQLFSPIDDVAEMVAEPRRGAHPAHASPRCRATTAAAVRGRHHGQRRLQPRVHRRRAVSGAVPAVVGGAPDARRHLRPRARCCSPTSAGSTSSPATSSTSSSATPASTSPTGTSTPAR